jgi:predicted nucleic acid-binding protein
LYHKKSASFYIQRYKNLRIYQRIISDNFKDLEDSYQYQAALNCNADVLLTINIKDFDGVKDKQQIKIMTPQTFVEQYQKSW